MRIGIDIDGVLTNVEEFSVDYFSKYLIENNIKYNVGESDYCISETFNVDKKIGDEFWDEYIDFYAKNVKPRTFASEVIKKLKQDGNEIYIVTSRWLSNGDDEVGENMRKIVVIWLEQNDITYDKLVFAKGKREQKNQEMLDNEIDLMIEDNPSNISQLSTILPIICYDTNYNRDCTGNNIHRCYSWYDIYNKISDGIE